MKLRHNNDQVPRARSRLFFFITISIPVFLFVGLEVLLRLLNYGPNLALFVTEEIGGTVYHIMNPDVKYRYFSRVPFSPNTSLDYFRVPKPAGTYRIFALGASTTVGFPYGQAGSFTAFLRDRLQQTFPQRRLEVINLGMTATNSYTTVDIARELRDYEPDLLLVYDGHNEFYGALGIASRESLGPSHFLNRLYLRLIHFRTFQLIRNTITSITQLSVTSPPSDQMGTMMEQLAREQEIPYGSDLYHSALQAFKNNLQELADICRDMKVPLIIATQVSNLRDLPPFVSAFQHGLSTDDQIRFNDAMAKAANFFETKQIDSALAYATLACEIDSLRADARYLLARCLNAKKIHRRAMEEYIAARDYDLLRFRASSHFNKAIRDLGNREGVVVADIEAEFCSASPDSIVGSNLILEHLHPSLQGYFLTAKIIARVMAHHEMLSDRIAWIAADTIPDETLWNGRSVTIVEETAARWRLALLTSRWPFQKTAQSSSIITSNTPFEKLIRRFVNGEMTWEEIHVRAAELFEETGQLDLAAHEYEVLLRNLPLSSSAYYRLAQIHILRGTLAEAKSVLERSLAIEQSTVAYLLLGQIALEEKNHPAALRWLEEAFRLSSTVDDRSTTGYHLAVALLQTNQRPRAVEVLEHVLSVKPQFPQARALLDHLKRP